MENFIVSARKYRPSTFDLVVGQLSITTTLKNAIKNNHLAQAYLFCGPRGVGKTTCARIFAKTINCFNLNDKIEPCDQCESCKSFNQSRSFNIHELDAASNNSVDDIRTLIEQVRIPPQVGKYSIYIIDEVHMLSTSAFNAFLKTLEEPPKHAVFILATTEKHKIIPTILSRCQIFDFNRIQIDDTVQFLEKISKNENNEYETDGLNIIAQKADGAMRDALSIYDQIVSFSGGKISYKNVIENLNVLDYDYFFKLTDAFLTANIAQSFVIYDDILNKGFDSHNFIVGLNKHFRDLLVCKDQTTLQLLEVGNNIKEKYKQQTAQCPPDFLFDCMAVCGLCDTNFRNARNQRLHVELALVQLCQVLNKKKNDELAAVTQLKTEPIASKPVNSPNSVAYTSRPTAQTTTSVGTSSVGTNSTKYISTTPSIKNLMKESPATPPSPPPITPIETKDAEETDDIPIVVREHLFNQEQLNMAYSHFVESIKNEKPRLYSTMNTIQLQLSGKETIEITLNNQAQLDDFNKNVKSDMIKRLRDELLNDNIVLHTVISEMEQQNMLYTAEEKYKHLLAKNPALGKLRQQMNLDFD